MNSNVATARRGSPAHVEGADRYTAKKETARRRRAPDRPTSPPSRRAGTPGEPSSLDEEAGRDIEEVSSMQYRRAAKQTRCLPEALVDEVGGLETHLGTPRLTVFILARAGVVYARARRANAESSEVIYENGLCVKRKPGTFIKSIESFAADWWARILKRLPVEGGSRQKNRQFRRLYGRFHKTVQRMMRSGGKLAHLLEDTGPAYPSEHKAMRDFHGRRFKADPRLADFKRGGSPLGLVQCTGKSVQRDVLST